MRAYVLTTGAVFGLLVVAHLWRAFIAEPHLATDPSYIAITLVAGALFLWACRVLKLISRD